MTQDQLRQSQQATSRQGNLGEQFALAFERKRLPEFLHGQIVHFKEHEIALGYDILSFETRTSILPDRYIEVKTFRGHPHFYWTDNEIVAARKYAEHYYLYLIDIDRINDSNYEPQIIPNPVVLFDEPLISEEKMRFNAPSSNSSQNGRPWPSHPTTEVNGHTWTFHPVQYAFSLNAEANIPQDWDTSTILLGCYSTEQHLRWILDHSLYNVRAQKDIPGAVTLNNPQVRQAKYLVLYSVCNPRVYMLYALEPKPYRITKTEMQVIGYPNPHAFSYILHPIRERLNTFHIDLAPILREVNHQGDNTYGTPLYLTGIQLRRFMPQPASSTSIHPQPPHSEPYMAPHPPSSPTISEPYLAPQSLSAPLNSEPYMAPQASSTNNPAQPPSPRALKSGSPWTPEDDTLLITHLQQHTPIAEIAPLLQRSEKAIVRRTGRLRKAEVILHSLLRQRSRLRPPSQDKTRQWPHPSIAIQQGSNRHIFIFRARRKAQKFLLSAPMNESITHFTERCRHLQGLYRQEQGLEKTWPRSRSARATNSSFYSYNRIPENRIMPFIDCADTTIIPKKSA